MKEVTLYTATYCGYCSAAKQMLKQLNLPYKEVNLDGEDALRQRLSAANGGWRTVPMIFVGEEFIGGYTDMQALHKKGELLPKVQA